MSTKHFVIECQKRKVIGNSVRKLRREGILPAVMYGNKQEPVSISMPLNQFSKVYKDAGKTSVIDITIDSKKVPCLVHDIDFDPVKDTVRHVDFLIVNLKQKTHANVPLVFINEPSKEAEGVLVKQLDIVEVEALPDEIPHELEVDLSRLTALGDLIRAEDLTLPAGVTLITETDSVLALLAQESVDEEPETPETIVEGSEPEKSDSETANNDNDSK